MVDILANIKRLESLITSDGTHLKGITHVTQEFNKVCRTCLAETTVNDLDNYIVPANDATMMIMSIRAILEASTGLKAPDTNCLPNHICHDCLRTINMIFIFRMQAKQIDEALKGFLEKVEKTPPSTEALDSPIVVDEDDSQPESSIQIDEYQVTYVKEEDSSAAKQESGDSAAAQAQLPKAAKTKPYRCGMCLREFTFRSGLNTHIRFTHLKTENNCLSCGEMFETSDMLRAHKKWNCQKYKPVKVEMDQWQAAVTIKDEVIEIKNFQCSICDQALEMEKDFLAHVQTHVNETTCKYCNKTYSRPSYLESHIRSHSKVRPFVCPLCPKGFTSTTALRCHLKSYNERLAQTCKICQAMFCNLKDYLMHCNLHEELSKHPDLTSGFEESSRNETSAEKPSPSIVKQVDMPDEPVRIKKERVDDEHVPIANEPLSDDEQDHTPLSVYDDIQVKSEPDDPSEPMQTYDSLDENYAPGDDASNIPDGDEEGEDNNQEKTLDSAHDDLFGNFACPDAKCDEKFRYVRDVFKHYTSTHCGKPPHTCTVCQQVFQTKNDIRPHLKEHIKCAFNCPYCQKEFWIMRDLRNHLRTHTGERPFQCSLCSQRFKQRPALRVHIRTHNTTKEYKCQHCNKEFFSYNGMFLHQKSHLKIKELQCQACHKQFPTLGRLKRHQSSVCAFLLPAEENQS